MGKTVDFDLFLAEQREETFDVVVGGVAYPVRMAFPAVMMVENIAAESEGDMEARKARAGRATLRSARVLFGEENLQRILDTPGMSVGALSALVMRCMRVILGQDEEGGEAAFDETTGKTAEDAPGKK